jgi:hypothetical protein
MSTLELKELSHPAGEVIKIAVGKTLDLKNQGSVTMPTGSVLQVVSYADSVSTSTSSTAFVGSTIQATITPSSTSSKILVIMHGFTTVSINAVHAVVTIYRGNTTNLGSSYGMGDFYTSAGGYTESTFSCNYLDAPNSVSPINYRAYCRTASTGTMTLGNGARVASITLMEIQG